MQEPVVDQEWEDAKDLMQSWGNWVVEQQIMIICPFKICNRVGAFLFWCLGVGLCGALYYLIGLHFYAFINVICPLLKKRFGTELGLLWAIVGLVIVFNIVYNHFLAMILKPGQPSDVKMIENMRKA